MRSYSASESTQMVEKLSDHLIAQNALDQVQIVIDQRRRLRSIRTLLDLIPQADQEAQVRAQLLFARVLCRRANDKAAGGLAFFADQNALQPLPLFVRPDLARHSDVVDRRHEDQKASGQRDVAGDARALLRDRLLGNLDQDLLPLLQQLGDDRQVARLR